MLRCSSSLHRSSVYDTVIVLHAVQGNIITWMAVGILSVPDPIGRTPEMVWEDLKQQTTLVAQLGNHKQLPGAGSQQPGALLAGKARRGKEI